MSNFIYCTNTIAHLENILSSDRFQTYIKLAEGDKIKGLALYKENIQLSHHFYTIIHILEVCLRNKVDISLAKQYGHKWYVSPNLLLSDIQQSQMQSSLKHDSHGKFIASLPFGFWTTFFGRCYEELWRHNLRFIFDCTIPLKRSSVAASLKDIRNLRNRIAHHECIIKMDLPSLEEACYTFINWLSPITLQWLKIELLNEANCTKL